MKEEKNYVIIKRNGKIAEVISGPEIKSVQHAYIGNCEKTSVVALEPITKRVRQITKLSNQKTGNPDDIEYREWKDNDYLLGEKTSWIYYEYSYEDMSYDEIIRDLMEVFLKNCAYMSRTLAGWNEEGADEILDNPNRHSLGSGTFEYPLLLCNNRSYSISRAARNFKFYDVTDSEKKEIYAGTLEGELGDVFKKAYIGEKKRMSVIRAPYIAIEKECAVPYLTEYNEAMKLVDSYLETCFAKEKEGEFGARARSY